MRQSNSQKNSIGCLGFIGIIILIYLGLSLYSICWIQAIFVLIYCFFSKKYRPYRVRNSIICGIIIITSVAVYTWLNAPNELNSISVDWGKTEFYIGEETEIKVDPHPSDAEINKLELSQNDIASLKYKDGKAVIKFKKEGTSALFFTANDNIYSSTEKITVIDKEKEEAAQKAKEKEKQQKALAQQQEKQKENQQQTEEKSDAESQSTQQQNEDPVVYITNTGSKYHSSSCRTLKKSKIERHLSEVKGSYAPCGICNPPQ